MLASNYIIRYDCYNTSLYPLYKVLYNVRRNDIAPIAITLKVGRNAKGQGITKRNSY
jgi:hypothetical protein